MATAILKDGTKLKYKITLDMFCEHFGMYRPYLTRGWDDTEYRDFILVTANILNIEPEKIERAYL